MPDEQFNKRLTEELKKSSIRNIFKKAGKEGGGKIADMSLGNPYGRPPDRLAKALLKLIKDNPSHAYMDNAGYYETRREIAKFLVKKGLMPRGLRAEGVVVTVGSSGALNCILKSLLNPGDEVLVLCPYFPDFSSYVENHGGIPVIVKQTPSEFEPDTGIIGGYLTEKTKAIIVNTPNNPTGKVYSRKQIKEMHKLLLRAGKKINHPIYLISDETYRNIIFSDSKQKEFVSPASNYPYSVMVYSFSKSACVPGERIGYAAVNPRMPQGKVLAELVSLSQRKLGFTNAPAMMQQIMGELLTIRPKVKDYERKRDIICESLKRGGYSFIKPEGAFYFFVKYPYDEKWFLDKARSNGLFVVPGRAFGQEGYFRIAFSRDIKTVNLAAKILEESATFS